MQAHQRMHAGGFCSSIEAFLPTFQVHQLILRYIEACFGLFLQVHCGISGHFFQSCFDAFLFPGTLRPPSRRSTRTRRCGSTVRSRIGVWSRGPEKAGGGSRWKKEEAGGFVAWWLCGLVAWWLGDLVTWQVVHSGCIQCSGSMRDMNKEPVSARATSDPQASCASLRECRFLLQEPRICSALFFATLGLS